jgi:GTP-binding protein
MQTKLTNDLIRNIAIIAHVDHGKTTLVDSLFKKSGTFRENQDVSERVMDKLDLERERGITISAKNCAIQWNGVKINIIDTPGHADFGGEVERAISMADGAVLLVDAAEGPLPQTRFVLTKALAAGLAVIVVINKIDRQDARPQEVLNEVYDLLIDLDASEEQLEFPVIYAVGRDGIAKRKPEDENGGLDILLDLVLEEIPAPRGDVNGAFQMLISDLSYSDYIGRLAIGKIYSGRARTNDALVCIGESGVPEALRITRIQTYAGPSITDASEVDAGDILILAGIENVHIGDTICTKDNPVALKRITVDEPTVSMRFNHNTSPLAGTEGKIVQPSRIFDRLKKEAMQNVSLRVFESEDKNGYVVQGRGEFQMVILIETMRREGFELCVGRPAVIFKYEKGKKLEPIEHLFVDCLNAYTGIVTEKLSRRKGKVTSMVNHESGRVRIEFSIPSRSLIGYRDEFMTDTKGTGILNSYLSGYEEYRGDFAERYTGSLVSDREGTAIPYAIFNLEPRGTLFVAPGDPVYAGMIVGEHNRDNDLNINITKEKKLSNMRAAGKDDNIILTPVLPMTLERAIQFIREDELVEVTPKSVRLRKSDISSQRRRF